MNRIVENSICPQYYITKKYNSGGHIFISDFRKSNGASAEPSCGWRGSVTLRHPPLLPQIRPPESTSLLQTPPQFLSLPPPQTCHARQRRRLFRRRCHQTPPPPSNVPSGDESSNSIAFVGQENVPLEGVIQFEKPSSTSLLVKWGIVAGLAAGDVAALLLFSAIGRFSHGFPVFDLETLKTADPFIAGWFLSAYFLGGYGEDGRGKNGLWRAVTAAAKSWSLGIPLGLIIRAATIGHAPPTSFILVTMGSTAVLLVGWRALLFSIFPTNKGKKSDVYKRVADIISEKVVKFGSA
ncbi:UNVERIFIED_CONTAM: hypothetical protein Scaly_1110800 [Sesamum calycinum]|uniref:Transmembrane protein n=1 Tax=Sesamum calycinum TaxID=2727403 RepID=A0AAW2QMR8_9LAMI